jgi:hypothetical protein
VRVSPVVFSCGRPSAPVSVLCSSCVCHCGVTVLLCSPLLYVSVAVVCHCGVTVLLLCSLLYVSVAVECESLVKDDWRISQNC